MKYLYLVVEEYQGRRLISDILPKFEFSLSSLYQVIPKSLGNVVVYSFCPSSDLLELCARHNTRVQTIRQARTYPGDPHNPRPFILDILVEKIVVLRDFPESEECVLLDLDTKVLADFLGLFDTRPVMGIREYPLLSERNLHKVLPFMPFEEMGIRWNPDFFMYNSGFLFIPSKVRRQLCEKALLIVDRMNAMFPGGERYGNGLDEQIAFSIAIQDHFQQNIQTVEGQYFKHFWPESMAGETWWPK